MANITIKYKGCVTCDGEVIEAGDNLVSKIKPEYFADGFPEVIRLTVVSATETIVEGTQGQEVVYSYDESVTPSTLNFCHLDGNVECVECSCECAIEIDASVDPTDDAAVWQWILINGNSKRNQTYFYVGGGTPTRPDYVFNDCFDSLQEVKAPFVDTDTKYDLAKIFKNGLSGDFDIVLTGSDGTTDIIDIPSDLFIDESALDGTYSPNAANILVIPITYTDTSGGVPVETQTGTLNLDLSDLDDPIVTGFNLVNGEYVILREDGVTFTQPITDVDLSVPNQVTITDAEGDVIVIDTEPDLDKISDTFDSPLGTLIVGGTGDKPEVDVNVAPSTVGSQNALTILPDGSLYTDPCASSVDIKTLSFTPPNDTDVASTIPIVGARVLSAEVTTGDPAFLNIRGFQFFSSRNFLNDTILIQYVNTCS